jgi:nitrogen regulatory protein PII
MKMVMITYNEAVDAEVMDALENCGVKNYTKILSTYGKGETSGVHMGNDIWPGRNNIIFAACENAEAKKLISAVKELRSTLGKEGIKAFSLPIEEMT